jgi:hypothetical protein
MLDYLIGLLWLVEVVLFDGELGILLHLLNLRGLMESLYSTRFDGEILIGVLGFEGDVLIIIVNFKVHVTIIIIYRIIQYILSFLIATYRLLICILNFN